MGGYCRMLRARPSGLQSLFAHSSLPHIGQTGKTLYTVTP